MGWLDGITDSMNEFEQAPGDGERQASLACCSPWGHKELATTELLNSTDLWMLKFDYKESCEPKT